MSNDKPSLAEASTIDEELVAYLDGELSPDQAARIERRMGEDPKYRARLNQLQRAWDMLDSLNRSEADDDFVHSTVEMVAVQAVEEAKTQKIRTIRRRNFGWVSLLVLLLGVAGTTYFAARYRLEQPNRELVTNLHLIERVDDYRNIDSLEFVKQLEAENLFAAEVHDGL
jgi:anti-sigma-K factor RskA